MSAATNAVLTDVGAGRRGGPRVLNTVLRFGRRKPLGAVCAVIILIIIICGAVPQLIAPYRYDDFNVRIRREGPSREHLFGTDDQGRDVFSRVIYGARTTVVIGFGAVAISAFLATLIGVASGYYQGYTDTVVQRFIDVWLAFPGLIFIIFVAAIFGVKTLTLMIVIGLLFSAGSSRIVRSSAIVIRSSAYVDAGRAIGCSDLRLMLRHVFPNAVPIILIAASVQIGAAILLESSLSFLGFGVPPPYPSWGRMLQEGQAQMQNHPYLALFPGLAIALAVYSFNMFGDALRDVLDPRLRGAGRA
jgi:peptide/nickel transport system permease protein